MLPFRPPCQRNIRPKPEKLTTKNLNLSGGYRQPNLALTVSEKKPTLKKNHVSQKKGQNQTRRHETGLIWGRKIGIGKNKQTQICNKSAENYKRSHDTMIKSHTRNTLLKKQFPRKKKKKKDGEGKVRENQLQIIG